MTTTSGTVSADRPALRRPDGTPIRALVVDDEPALTDLLSMALRYEGWDVRTAADGAHAVTAARQFRPDVVLLDVMLPDLDGLTVLRRIRADDHDVPVVFLTAKDAVDDRVAGLTVGADDYVIKPFSLEEVVARLRALLRRAGATAVRSSGELVVGDLVMDEDGREVTRSGVPITLTATENRWVLEVPAEPVELVGGADRLHQVVVNLLGNARTHTPPGSTVTIGLSTEDGSVLLRVSDDGPGIPAELLPQCSSGSPAARLEVPDGRQHPPGAGDRVGGRGRARRDGRRGQLARRDHLHRAVAGRRRVRTVTRGRSGRVGRWPDRSGPAAR